MRAAQIQDGVVVNYAEVGGFDGVQFVDPLDSVIGSTWDGVQFTNPPPQPPIVPDSVTRRQARQALLLAGLLDKVQPAIDAITDPVQRGLVQIEWDDSQEFERQRPVLLQLAAAIGLDGAALDQLFITAAGL